MPTRRYPSVLALLAFAVALSRGAPAAAEMPMQGPLGKYLDRLSVLPGKDYKGLTVYALVAKEEFPLGDYLTLDEAFKRGSLKVTELEGGAQVNTLLLENTGDRHVFILAGEVLKGAKQDRTIQSDLLVPPRSGKLKVSAFCTEQGRWVETSRQFQAAEISVPNSVRKAAKQAKEQGKVWDNIARAQSKLSVSAPSGAAKAIYESSSVQADMKPYLEKLADVPKLDPHTVGVAAAFGDKLVALDVFGDDDLLRKLYSKLLRSYVVDVMGDAWHGTTSAEDVRKFLSSASRADWEKGKTDGVGLGIEFKEPPLAGSALLYKEMVVHSDLFLADVETIEDRRPDRRPPPNLEMRRQQRQR
ncbi:MAG: hypothetical protein FJZ01_19950 [Candidatus Sericytochromatia bacterium]|nr:hypothetical protein [Candidatus Tanganyikabacteria bacterium]